MIVFNSHLGVFGYEKRMPVRIISPLFIFWRRKNTIGEIIRFFLFYHLIFYNTLDFTSPHHYNINARAFKFGVILSISKPLCYKRFLKYTSIYVFLFLTLAIFSLPSQPLTLLHYLNLTCKLSFIKSSPFSLYTSPKSCLDVDAVSYFVLLTKYSSK